MAEQPESRRDDAGPPLPLGQRLLDSPFLLLFAGVVIMVVFYTAWGLYEILSLKPAPLP
ncbi:MAG TPA: hypothetical protein VJ816_12515 [Gemmatimonadales bacterium]|nr:hypothetical protein [Gemmatimonadales bacterium]